MKSIRKWNQTWVNKPKSRTKSIKKPKTESKVWMTIRFSNAQLMHHEFLNRSEAVELCIEAESEGRTVEIHNYSGCLEYKSPI